MTPDQLRDLAIQTRSSLEVLCRGRGTPDDFQQLCIASNISLILCEGGLGTEHLSLVKDAQARIQEYGLSCKGSSPTQEQHDAIALMLDLQDQQLAHEDCTEGRMAAALREIQYRITHGHARVIG